MEEERFYFLLLKAELKSLKYNLTMALLMFTLKSILV